MPDAPPPPHAALTPAPDLLERVLPLEAARRHGLVPLGADAHRLRVAAAAPLAPSLLRELVFLTGREIDVTCLEPHVLDAHLGALGIAVAGGDGAASEAPAASPPDDSAPERSEPSARRRAGDAVSLGRGPVPEQVDRLVAYAARIGASDVHAEPDEEGVRVRVRLDGVLREVGRVPKAQREAFAARLKVMARLDVAERRRPQDGRIRFELPREGAAGDRRRIDLRVSTLPVAFGEKVVLRLLDKERLELRLEALGLGGDDLATVRGAIERPHGLVLVTGPTGSGKTTTLYAGLRELARPELNVSTIEDPVEYHLPGVNQTQVRPEIEVTFARALRAMLRQDPDVVMVGEIRDEETAEIAVRAALTGHLVLSTLHTNDAPGAAARLVDMGVAPYLVASALTLIVAQRLVRLVCPECAGRAPLDAALARRLGEGTPATLGEEVTAAVGCEACAHAGYRGRTAVYEVLPVTDALRDLLARRASTSALRREALAGGMATLRTAALDLLRAGRTTPEEVLRATTV